MVAVALAAPKPAVVATSAALVEPVVAAPAVVTATSSQFFHRNVNSFAAPLVAAPVVTSAYTAPVVASAYSAPFVAAPALANPFVAAPTYVL